MNKKSILTFSLLMLVLTGCAGSHDNAAVAIEKSPSANDAGKLYTKAEDSKERDKGHAVAYFAAGCFWGVEDAFKHVKGVVDTTVGFSGGITESPSYRDVCGHGTKHAETVRIVFDPKIVSYDALVNEFLDIHDPTTIDRQGVDIGDQYRSAIFYSNESEQKEAKAVIANYQASGKLQGKIVTALKKFDKFYSAEDYHQDYFEKRGVSGCHIKRR